MKQKPAGWKNDPYRHSLAARGVKTVPYPRKFKGDSMDVERYIDGDLGPHHVRPQDKITGEAAIKLQMVKENHWDNDFDAIHGMMKRALNSPGLPTRYTFNKLYEWADTGTLNENIIKLVNATHPNFADLSKTVIIHDFGGILEGVYNVPKGWKYEHFVIEEGEEEKFDRLPKLRSKTIRVTYYQALPETIEGLPKGYDYVTYFDG